MMKHPRYRITGILLGIMLIGIVSTASGEMILSTGVSFNRVQDDLEAETTGTEFTFPIGLQYTRNQFSLGLETGYGRAQVDLADGSEAKLSSLTDTLLSASYMISGLPLMVSCGVNVNLPTGKEQLTLEEEEAILGENNDLFEVETFGEGLNWGVNLMLIKQFGDVTIGTNGLYVSKGEYDRTEDTPDDNFDPGDQILMAGLVNWEMSPYIVLDALAVYSYFFVDRVNGEKEFQEGSSFAVSSGFQYTHAPVNITFRLQEKIPQKDKELVEGSLKTEEANSGSNVFAAILNLAYTYSSSLTLEMMGDIRYYSESDRKDAESGLPYAGKRIRYSSGPGIRYAINDQIACSALAKYVRLDEEQDLYMKEERTFQGVNVKIGITYTF